ncbi:RNA polymerase I specific transcription initiation factor domain containing protein [Hyaloscypha variabilis]
MSSPSPSPPFETPDRIIPDSQSDSDSLSPSPTRPNRWLGAPSTWASHTSQERGLAASLQSLQNRDLSLHLYNAFALKKNARDVRKGEIDEGQERLPEEDRTWEPPRYWTSWPLRPEDVPREGEVVGLEDPDERYTFRRVEREGGMPSEGLEEVLVGTTLRFAKEVFMGRQSAGFDEGILGGDGEDEDMVVEKEEAGGPSGFVRDGNAEEMPTSAQVREKEVEPIVKEGSEPPQPRSLFRPVVSADDDRSRELLRPSIRHTLSKLDEVLMALHHARKTCLQYSHSEFNSDEETPVAEEEEELTTSIKRPAGRPRKFSNLTDRSRSQIKPIDDSDLFRAKKTHRGRPQKVYERLEGESQQEYLVRIARIQKRPLPAFAPPRETPETPERRGSSKSPARRATEEEREKARQRRIKPRDWSEVLGAAALVGFRPDVIARATQRCANLFGESMIMRSMPEMPYSEKDGDVLTEYRPQAIPDLDDEDEIESKESEDLETSSSESAPLRQTSFCPIADCPRKTRGFNGINKLKRHLQRGHEIPREELEEYLLPSDEERDGAIHTDGFLKPMKQLAGARGRYKKEGKRSRAESEDEESEEEPAVCAGSGRSERAEAADDAYSIE